MKDRPSGAVFSLLIAGVLILFLGMLISGFFIADPYRFATGNAMYVDAVICGFGVLASALLLFILPRFHIIWGVLAILFAFSSIVSLGGLFIGMILGVTGGAMGVVWRRRGKTPQSPTPQIADS